MEWKKILKRIGLEIFKSLKWIALALLAAFAAYKIGMFLLAKKGRVDKPKRFVPVPGDDSKILVRDDEKKEWVKVALPSGVKSKDVKAAGFAEGDKTMRVEVIHEKVDRRNSTPIDDSAADRLRPSD